VDDAATLAQMQGSNGNGGMTLESMRMCLDKKDYVPPRMVMQGRLSGQGQPAP